MRALLAFLIPVFLLSAAGALFAQDQAAEDRGANQGADDQAAPGQTATEQAAPAQAPRRLLFVMEKSVLFSGYSDNEMIVLKRSFLTVLSEAEGAPTPIDYSLKSFPSSVTARNRAAREAGADCWLVLKMGGLRATPTLNVVSYDLLYDIKTLDFTSSRTEGFSMLDIYRERWDDVIPLLVKKYPPLASRAYSRGPPAPVTLTIRAVPGTILTGLSLKPLSVGPDGKTSVELPSPAPYSLRAVASGYVPSRKDIYLDGPTELTLEQARSPWLRLDGAFLDGFFPGVAANFSIPSLPFFARVGFTTFRVGIAVNRDQFLTSLALSQLSLLLGGYLSPEDSSTRWYLGAGPLLRISLPSNGSLVVDQLLPFGVQAVAGVEFPLAGTLRSFVELAPTGYYTPLPALFVASFAKDGSTFPYVNFPPKWALNPFEVRFGLRWIP